MFRRNLEETTPFPEGPVGPPIAAELNCQQMFDLDVGMRAKIFFFPG